LGRSVTRARVLSFHIDSHELVGLSEALDGVAAMFADQSDFRGLVCLTHDGVRKEVMVITLWDGEGLEATQEGSDEARERIASTTDLGVGSKVYEVLRLVPGTFSLVSVFSEDSDILGFSSRGPPHRPVGKRAAGL